jgi:F-type H+-transporting ATPase subunit epsilon
MYKIPGEEGQMGILAGHASLISSLKPGVIKFTSANNNQQHIFVAGGFADITANNVTVLAEEAIPLANLKREELEKKLSLLQEDMKNMDGATDKARLQNQIDIVKAKLSAVS